MAPWVAWGPYLWIDGLTTRSDGLTWPCSDVVADFVHPSTAGQSKVALQLLAFAKTDPVATPWFLKSTVTGQPPTAGILASQTSGAAPLTVNFTPTASDPDGTITQYAWSFSDATYSLTQNPTKVFSRPGTYTARLTVTDNQGNTARASVPITVTSSSSVTDWSRHQ